MRYARRKSSAAQIRPRPFSRLFGRWESARVPARAASREVTQVPWRKHRLQMTAEQSIGRATRLRCAQRFVHGAGRVKIVPELLCMQAVFFSHEAVAAVMQVISTNFGKNCFRALVVCLCSWIARLGRSVILHSKSSRLLDSKMILLDSITATELCGPCVRSAQFFVVIDVILITAPIAARGGHFFLR